MISQETIEKVVRHIAERFDPLRITVFGSYARGDAAPDSDLDLFVEMDSSLPRRERQLMIRESFSPRAPCPMDIVVYTPEEAEYGERLAPRWFPWFAARARSYMNAADKELFRKWVVKAEEDLLAARKLLGKAAPKVRDLETLVGAAMDLGIRLDNLLSSARLGDFQITLWTPGIPMPLLTSLPTLPAKRNSTL